MAEMTPLVLEIKANTSQATASIRKLKHDMSGIGRSMNTGSFGKDLRSIGKDAKWAGKQIGSALMAPMKNLTANIKNTVGAIGKLGAAFKRILFYRAIRSMIREIGDAFKYGINNLYAWSSGVGGQFAASMNQIATAFNYFKNSVGAAVAPLINALAPAIDFVIDKAVTLLNVINQLFARLTGQTYWTRATKQAAAYGGAVSAAGGAAKEAMRYLAPFDELNVLPDNSGGGGGGGSGGGGASGLFEDVVEFDQSINDLFELINNNKFFEAGQLLADKVGEIVDALDAKITSADFRNKILGTLSNITEIINGFFSELTFEDGTKNSIAYRIGKLVGDAAGLAIESVHTWLAGIDWSTIGVAIGQFVNGGIDALKSQNFNLGSIIADVVNKQINLLSGFTKTVNWAGVGDWIAQNINSALTGIDWSKAITSLVDLATGILTAINNAIAGINFKSVLTQIYNGLKNADWAGLWEQVKEFIKNTWGVGAIALAITILPELGSIAKTITQGMILKAIFGGGSSAAGATFSILEAGALALEIPVLVSLVAINKSELGTAAFAETQAELGAATYSTYEEALKAAFNDASNQKWMESSFAGAYSAKMPVQLESGEWVLSDDGKTTIADLKKLSSTISSVTDYDWFDNPISPFPTTTNDTTGEVVQTGLTTNNGLPVTLIPTGVTFPSDWEEPKINSVADLKEALKDKLEQKKPKITSQADFASWDYKTGVWKRPGLVSQATFASWAYKSGVWKRPGLISEADFASWDYKSGIWKRPGLISKAMFAESGFASKWKQPMAYTTAVLLSHILASKWTEPSVYTQGVLDSVTNPYPTWEWVSVKVQGIINSVKSILGGAASGGAYYGGFWHSIPQYASGGNVHGSLFLAGEAGPEIVGHVGGRTEVLNQSQLASSISAGVARAINSAHFAISGLSSVPADTGYDEDTLYRAFLRALNDADISNDTYLDGEKIYDSTVRYNQRRTRMTGVNAMA